MEDSDEAIKKLNLISKCESILNFAAENLG
jgi:hypothetical protein